MRFPRAVRWKLAGGRMDRAVLTMCLVISLSSLATSAPAGIGFYGSGVGADGLSNTQIGGTDAGRGTNREVAFRFRAQRSGSLTAVRLYQKYTSTNTGYSAGSGGVIEYTLREDDDSPRHHPAETVLGRVVVDNVIGASTHFPLLAFSPAPVVREGRLYHVVARNLDPAPQTNFISLNSLWSELATSPRQPTMADRDWALLFRDGPKDRWSERDQTPILELNYADGHTHGIGYVDVWASRSRSISGDAAVAEVFKVAGSNRKVSQVAFRVRRSGGRGGLAVKLEEGGTVLDQGNIPANAVPTTYAWVTYKFVTTQTLRSATEYRAVLSAPSDTVYVACAIQDGSVKYGFGPATVFADGHAQYSVGSGWVDWGGEGVRGRKDAHLQFFFTVEG